MKKSEPHPSTPPAAGSGDPLEALFEQARGEDLGPGEMSALWARVSAAGIGASAPRGGAETSAAGASTAAGASIKTVAALLVAGGLVAAVAGVHYWPAPPRSALAPSGVTATTPAGPASPAEPAPSGMDRPDPSPRSVEVSALPSVAGHARPAPRSRPAGVAEGRDVARETSAQQAAEPSEAANRAPESATGRTTGGLGDQGVTGPAQGPRPDQGEATSPAPASAPAPSEAALLLRARRTLDSDPAGALALTDEHARQFPRGTLVPEREVLAIEALARLGRSSEARRRLDALRARFPNAANVARLDALIGR
jgi:hypothetical protein